MAVLSGAIDLWEGESGFTREIGFFTCRDNITPTTTAATASANATEGSHRLDLAFHGRLRRLGTVSTNASINRSASARKCASLRSIDSRTASGRNSPGN